MDEEKPRRPLRRWLIAVGVLCLVAAVAFFALAFAPVRSGSEPGWLLETKPSSAQEDISRIGAIGGGHGVSWGPEAIVGARTWELEMTFDEFVQKMNRDLPKAEGWTYTKNGGTATWNRSTMKSFTNFWAYAVGNKLLVTESYMHELRWPDRFRRWMKRTVGM